MVADELCRFVEINEALFRTAYADATALTKKVKGGEPISVLVGGPHDRSRRFHMRLLSPSAIESIRVQHIRPIIDWLINRFASRGKVDLAQDLAFQISIRGVIYVFRAKRSDRIKLIWWDGTGLCLMAKTLETGGFKWPGIQNGVIRLTAALLGVLLEGLDWRRVHGGLRPQPPQPPQIAG